MLDTFSLYIIYSENVVFAHEDYHKI